MKNKTIYLVSEYYRRTIVAETIIKPKTVNDAIEWCNHRCILFAPDIHTEMKTPGTLRPFCIKQAAAIIYTSPFTISTNTKPGMIVCKQLIDISTEPGTVIQRGFVNRGIVFSEIKCNDFINTGLERYYRLKMLLVTFQNGLKGCCFLHIVKVKFLFPKKKHPPAGRCFFM